MKLFATIALLAIFALFIMELDDWYGWSSKVKYWIREKLGLCNHCEEIVFEEEYSKEGEPYYHHTYKITRCKNCGKEFDREQLQ